MFNGKLLIAFPKKLASISQNDDFFHRVMQFQRRFTCVDFQPCRAIPYTIFQKIMAEVKASVPPHELRLRLGVSEGMLPVSSFAYHQSLFVC